MNVTGPCCWEVNIGLGNGLVPSGTKPLSEPMLTQIHEIIYEEMYPQIYPQYMGIKSIVQTKFLYGIF